MKDNDRFVNFVLKVKREFDSAFSLKLEQYGLTVAQALMIREIGFHKDGHSLSEIAKQIGVNCSLVTRSMKILLERGYVRSVAADGRTQCVTITPDGREFLKELSREIDEFVEDYLKPLSKEEVNNIKDYVEKLYPRDVL